jgi:hypothetical protein
MAESCYIRIGHGPSPPLKVAVYGKWRSEGRTSDRCAWCSDAAETAETTFYQWLSAPTFMLSHGGCQNARGISADH